MMLIRVEAGHTLLPERLAMMLVAVEVGHVVGHVLSIIFLWFNRTSNRIGSLVNTDDELLGLCSRRIAQQHTYVKKPLGVAVCCRCGHMLWSCVDLPCEQTQWHE